MVSARLQAPAALLQQENPWVLTEWYKDIALSRCVICEAVDTNLRMERIETRFSG